MLSSTRWFAVVLLGVIGMSIFGCRVERTEVREEPRDREVIIERR